MFCDRGCGTPPLGPSMSLADTQTRGSPAGAIPLPQRIQLSPAKCQVGDQVS